MPWKSPRCPVHGEKGRKVGVSKTDPRKWIYECKRFIGWKGKKRIWEQHTFEDWAWKRRDELTIERRSRNSENLKGEGKPCHL